MNVPDLYRGNEPQIVDVQAVPVNSASDRLDFRSLLTILARRLSLFVSVAAVIFAAAVVLTLTATPTYKATAEVLLNVGHDAAPTADVSTTTPKVDDSSVSTEVEVIKSRELAEKVVAALQLDDDPTFNPSLPQPPPTGLAAAKASLAGALHSVKPEAPAPEMSQAEIHASVIDNLVAGLDVERAGETYTIDVGYSSQDPKKATIIANTFADLYSRDTRDQKETVNEQDLDVLRGKVQELGDEASAATAAVQQYRIANNLLSTTGSSLTEQEIAANNQSLTQAQMDLATDQSQLDISKQALQTSNGQDLGATLNDPTIQTLRAQQATAEAQVDSLSTKYGPRYQSLIDAKQQLDTISSRIQDQVNRIAASNEAKVRADQQRVTTLQRALNGSKGTLAENNRSMIGLNGLVQKQAAAESAYESYLNRLNGLSAQEGTQSADARVISGARTPLVPSSPNVPLNLLLGLVMGLGAGLVSAFLAEMTSTTLTTADDVEQRLGQTCLASIPLLSSVQSGKGGRKDRDPLTAAPPPPYAEAFLSLRTALRYAVDDPVKVVAMTSSLPLEGKTTSSIGLARSAAVGGQKVILIDCDLHRRGLTPLVRHASPKVGLVEVLTGKATLEEALVRDEQSGAMVLPAVAGKRENDELLTGVEMDALLDKLRERFDFIVLDTAPVLPIAATRALVAKTDAVVFAVRWRKTKEHAIRAALRLLPSPQVRLAGIILTRVDMGKQARYGYGDPGYYYKEYKQYYA